MSAAIIGSADPPCFQPFQCPVCQVRFTRHENLKRHASLHTAAPEKPSFACAFCASAFSRRDLRHRHVARKHPEEGQRRACKRRRRASSAAAATAAEASGDGRSDAEPASAPGRARAMESPPKQWNAAGGLEMLGHGGWSPAWLGGQPGAPGSSPGSTADNSVFGQGRPDGFWPSNLPYTREEWRPTAFQIAQGVRLFFTHLSHFIPFLHRPTFDPTQSAEYLVLSMLCLSYQYGEDPDAGEGLGTGDRLSQHCFHRARVLVASEGEQEDPPSDHLAVAQTYLLLEIAAMTCLGGRDSAYGLRVHCKMIALARSSGLTQPGSPAAATAQDLDALWRAFAAAESRKRTMFAIHQIDTLWYQILSVPRSLSHLEIKHELPCPADRWAAPSAAAWAHRQLLGGPAAPPLPYAAAVRRLLAADAAAAPMPAFDLFGAVNIAQFLLSSAREVSGWAAMTGRLSLERLEACAASLAALGALVHPAEARRAAAPVEATAAWQMAMIELRIWSPTHTAGVVQASVDSALRQLAVLAATSELSYGVETAQATRPHIAWFLRYLHDELAPDAESPWVTMYAYKAFVIAWQLVRAKIPGVMHIVGVEDGDVDGALAWARVIFRRREPRRLGKLIGAYLDLLKS